MPLIRSGSRDAISANIHDMLASGHPRAQAIAAALRTADDYGRRRAAGGSLGAPTAPTYQTASPMASGNASGQGILPSGLVNIPQVGPYQLDLSTGALSPSTVAALNSYAMRGLPSSTSPASAAPTVPSVPSFLEGDFPTVGGGGNKRGGRISKLAAGGLPQSAMMAPWLERSEAHMMDHPSGLVHGIGPGRTDTVPMNLASGSHVIPADIVSGLGQGSSLSGAHAMGMAMKGGPGGISLPSGPHKSMPLPRMPHLASGGDPHFEGHAIKIAKGGVPEARGGVRCVLAGGEWVLSPDEVQRVTYKGKRGHPAIDQWIIDRRKGLVKTLRELPGPVGMKK